LGGAGGYRGERRSKPERRGPRPINLQAFFCAAFFGLLRSCRPDAGGVAEAEELEELEELDDEEELAELEGELDELEEAELASLDFDSSAGWALA
jgi:hypothetical protein